MSCMLCSQLDLTAIVEALSRGQVLVLDHHPNWESLCTAVAEQCALCNIFKQAIFDAYGLGFKWSTEQINDHHQRRDKDNDSCFVLSTPEIKGAELRYDRRHDAKTRAKFTEDQLHIDATFPDGLGFRPLLRVCLESGTKFNIENRTISEYVDFNMCKEWLKYCSTSHDGCTSIVDTDLPSRLIDVGVADGSQEPKLVLTKGLKGRYVTLSHCWGDSNPPVTDAESFQPYLSCISFNTLPRTFQDAIITVRKLEYRYLWIDCFCIIQGDQDDWEVECARMHETFADSAFTIAGPGAYNTEVGFLHPRPKPAKPPFKFQVRNNEGLVVCSASIELRDRGACNSLGEPWAQPRSALSSRAWVVQERYLSPRILYFGTSQAYLECQTTHLFETHQGPRQSVHQDANLWVKRYIKFSSDLNEALWSWYMVVDGYSGRRLTKESDKLPALSGMASRVAKEVGGDYLAGIWRADLLVGLSWLVDEEFEGTKCLSKQPTSRKPPTWSWASCDYPTRNYVAHKDLVSTWDARIVDAAAVVPGRDPFGEVTHGEIILRGKLRQASLNERPSALPDDYWLQHSEKPHTDWYIVDGKNNDVEIAGLTSDDPSGATMRQPRQASGDLWYLLLGYHRVKPNPRQGSHYVPLTRNFWTGLALETVPDQTKVFRRLGYIRSIDYSQHDTLRELQSNTRDDQQAAETFFDGIKLSTITII